MTLPVQTMAITVPIPIPTGRPAPMRPIAREMTMAEKSKRFFPKPMFFPQRSPGNLRQPAEAGTAGIFPLFFLYNIFIPAQIGENVQGTPRISGLFLFQYASFRRIGFKEPVLKSIQIIVGMLDLARVSPGKSLDVVHGKRFPFSSHRATRIS